MSVAGQGLPVKEAAEQRLRPYYDHAGITIYHGDCVSIVPHLKADALLTDPPYAISVGGAVRDQGKGRGKRNMHFLRGDDDWDAMTSAVMRRVALASSCLHDRASVFVWCGHRQFGHIVNWFEGDGWSTRPLVWSKKCPPPSPPHSGFSAGLELCVYAYRPGRRWNGGSIGPSNVFVSDSYRHGQPGKVDHPTQKPLGMIRRQIELVTARGDTVLDPFMGSGTTLRAAKDLGRKAIGIEIEERYCEIAARRLAQEVLF